MTEEFYRLLGVKRDADIESIHAAYRAKAKRAHPDAPGGSREAWDGLNLAYTTLTDEKQRAAYDVLLASLKVEEAKELLMAGVKMFVCDASYDLGSGDVLALMREQMKAGVARLKALRRTGKHKLARAQEGLRRLRQKRGGEDIMATVMGKTIEMIETELAQLEATIELSELALEIAGWYDWDWARPLPAPAPEEPPAFRSHWVIFG